MSETNVLTYNVPNGINIKIYYLNNEYDTCPLNVLLDMVEQINRKISKYIGKDFFNGYKLNVYNKNRSDIPSELIDYGGLTWGWESPSRSWIKLDTNPDYKYVANILSHELFHTYARIVGYYDNPSNICMKELLNRNSIHDHYKPGTSELECSKEEMFPEYCRALFGADLAIGENHGTYPIASKVKGLKDTLLLILPVKEYLKNKNISQLEFRYLDSDLGFAGIMFLQTETEFTTNTYSNNLSKYETKSNSFWVYINRDAIYHLKNNQWIPYKRFE